MLKLRIGRLPNHEQTNKQDQIFKSHHLETFKKSSQLKAIVYNTVHDVTFFLIYVATLQAISLLANS